MTKEYWNTKLAKYKEQGLHEKPNPFATEIASLLPSNGKLLELGAGTGQDTRYFASLGYQVTAADISPEGLRLAEELSEGLKIQFIELDLEQDLPFTDEAFDVVYAHLSLHYFTHQKTREVFHNIHRVLRKGGALACLVNTARDPEIAEWNYEEVETDYYDNGLGIKKRYFSPASLEEFSQGLFETVLLDEKGRTHKDKISSLIRFVGKKI